VNIEVIKDKIRAVAGVHRCDVDDTLAAVDEVVEFFEGDEDKATLWFEVENHMLGGKTPMEMIRMERFQKLLSFIQTSLKENRR
jgi:hypothetical protein